MRRKLREGAGGLCGLVVTTVAARTLVAQHQKSSDQPQVRRRKVGTRSKRGSKARREELIARRVGRDAAERGRLSRPMIRTLFDSVDVGTYPVLGIYWPIRGEIDLREVARRHVAAGGIVALPVVVRNAALVEFWRWQPRVPMGRGLWNIPIPPATYPQPHDIPMNVIVTDQFTLGSEDAGSHSPRYCRPL